MDNSLSELVDILHKEKCSCVISTDGKITVYRQRGVKDLYRILHDTPELLDKALIADKVIGKGAAAIIILGRAKEIYADVISMPALELLKSVGIPVTYQACVPHIINRTGTGICPVESLCSDAVTAGDCLQRITGFINGLKGKE